MVNTIDPWQFLLLKLTNKMKNRPGNTSKRYMGGMVKAIERDSPDGNLDAAYKFQRQIDSEKIMIGINKYVTEEDVEIPFRD